MKSDVQSLSKELIKEFKKVSTCNVSDALDKLGFQCGIAGVRPLFDCPKIVGPAVTMKIIPYGPEVPTGHMGVDALSISREGDIIVIDNAGRVDQNCWGEVLSFAAQKQGISGVVIDGACRDVDVINEIEFPVYAKGIVPFTARNRNVQGDFNCTVQLGGVQVRPGDIIMADRNGIAVIPKENAEEVLNVSKELFNKEAEMVKKIQDGIPFAEVDKKAGYDRMLDKE